MATCDDGARIIDPVIGSPFSKLPSALSSVLLVFATACGDTSGPADGSPLDTWLPDARDIGADSPDALADTNIVDVDPVPGEWRLPESNRVGAVLPMHALYPRPDDETLTTAYHRVAHPDVAYRVRIAVQGGEWPFRYELLDGPPGASIVVEELPRRMEGGRIVHERSSEHGVLEWSTPSEGEHALRVLVTDQGGESVELAWRVRVDENAFVFIDAEAGDDEASGTFDDPLRTFAAGLWRNDDEDTRHAGRVAVFREGSYSVYASEPMTSPVLDAARKPSALMAMPGEAVTLDMSAGHFRTARRGGADDLFVSGVRFVGARSDLSNARLFNITKRSSRVTFWNVAFDDTFLGTVANDNPACIAFMSDGGFHENLALLDSTLGPGAAAQLIVTFDSRYVLFEGNLADGVQLMASNGDNFLHAKDDTNDLTIRNNLFRGRAGTSAIAVTNQITLESAANQEVCWNRVVYDGNQNVDTAIGFNRQTTTPDVENAHAYRNSVVSLRRAFRFSGAPEPIPVRAQGNAIWGAEGGGLGGNVVLGPVDNVVLEQSAFDENAGLIGDAWETHAGLAGADVVAR